MIAVVDKYQKTYIFPFKFQSTHISFDQSTDIFQRMTTGKYDKTIASSRVVTRKHSIF
jgi:hypothetical protein